MTTTPKAITALLTLITASFSVVSAQSSKPLVPADFEIPEKLETKHFILLPLSPDHVVMDYEAVMTSVESIKDSGHMGPEDYGWPTRELTLAKNLSDLEWHYGNFVKRIDYAYTVLSSDQSVCLGCVYINPSRATGYDAKVRMWVRKSAFDKGLDPILFNTVKKWLAEDWPFKNPGYPGREVDWEEWNALRKQK